MSPNSRCDNSSSRRSKHPPLNSSWIFSISLCVFDVFPCGTLGWPTSNVPALPPLPRKMNGVRSSATCLKKQKNFVVEVEFLRQGYDLAGSASFQGTSSPPPSPDWTEQAPNPLGFFASAHTYTRPEAGNARTKAPLYRVLVNDRLLNKERFVTLAHELGHIFCGHLGACLPGNGKDEESGWPDRRNTPLKIREIEAEAVAFLVAGRAGLTPASAAYLRPYAQTVDPGCVEMDLIVRAAGRIERLANAHYGKMQFK